MFRDPNPILFTSIKSTLKTGFLEVCGPSPPPRLFILVAFICEIRIAKETDCAILDTAHLSNFLICYWFWKITLDNEAFWFVCYSKKNKLITRYTPEPDQWNWSLLTPSQNLVEVWVHLQIWTQWFCWRAKQTGDIVIDGWLYSVKKRQWAKCLPGVTQMTSVDLNHE